MKRLLALVLALVMVLTFFGCARKTTDNDLEGVETNDDGSVREVAKKDLVNFLVMGHDRAASLTDVMMLVSYDTETDVMMLTQIPRDTYVELEGSSYHKMNGLYNYFVAEARDEDSEDPELDGCTKAAAYIGKTLGIKIHHAAVMDLDGFGDIVDAIGGVYMYVPYSMKYSDSAQNLYIDLPEGYNTLDGDEAEQFVRFRSGFANADLGRGDAQKMFMTAFIESVKKNITVSSVATIANAILESVKTDMKYREIIEIGTALLDVELSGITMMTIPGELASSFYVINKECVMNVLNEGYNIYADEITADKVDPEGIFFDESNAAMKTVYEKPAAELDYDRHNAQDVSDEDIYIPMK